MAEENGKGRMEELIVENKVKWKEEEHPFQTVECD
jgi:hypothetical protein